ncbi:TPA: ATP-binding protein [Yersinia enterocolitica]|nr:ATP-binding protein [Yersinia enterocolitica]
MLNSWDPLTASKENDTELLAASQKREIKNILKSYVGMYDSFSELIQNAMDAVERRRIENEPNYIPYLWLTINLKDNYFSITDNGVGFNEKEIKSFLAPNISFKNGQGTRGNKGVGATYIGYGFDYLQFGTKNKEHYFLGEMKGGRDWVEDNEGIKTRPMVVSSSEPDDFFIAVDRGSNFKIKFGGSSTRPKDLSWYKAKEASQWRYLLCLKTPLGAIDSDNHIKFTLKVIDEKGEETLLSDQMAKYVYPHDCINGSVNLKDILNFQKKSLEQGKDAAQIPSKYMQSNGMYEYFSTDDLVSLRNIDNEEKILIKKYSMKAYAYFVYSTSVWDAFNDRKAGLRKGYRVLKGGLQLVNNTMVQGEMLSIPLSSNIGYQNQCHVLVHFKDADPDLGRKGFQPELKEVAEKISVGIVNRFRQWNKKILKSDTGTSPELDKELALHEWIKKQEQYEADHPLTLKNKNFFNPVNEISITSEPQTEQDVIVLFNQLIAGGVIRGVKLLATSQVRQYDGIYRYEAENLDLYVFNKEKNPLGVYDEQYSTAKGPIKSKPSVLEYKYTVDALIREFHSEEKKEKDISLVIAWTIGNEFRKIYDVTSLLDLNNVHQRKFHGVTHIFKSHTNNFHVICLKELVDYLNDVDGVQEYHQKEYSDELF